MKVIRYALFILFLLICFPAFQGVSHAETYKYAVASSREAYFCSAKDLTCALFAVPYTYCVEVLSSDGEWYYARYAEDNGIYRAVYGYCLISMFTATDEPPENLYLNMSVAVTYTADSASTLPVLGDLTVSAAFYGTFYSGAAAYSYVLYNDSFGYINGANDDYPLNELPEESSEQTEITDESTDGGSKLITVLVLAGLAVAALVILYLTGRSRRFREE